MTKRFFLLGLLLFGSACELLVSILGPSSCPEDLVEGATRCIDDVQASCIEGTLFETNCDAGCNENSNACNICGDGFISEGEFCDAENVNGNDCQTLNLGGGNLRCNDTCDAFDTKGCAKEGACDNGEDDDVDGLIDCDDFDCASTLFCIDEVCTNNLDDDDDGLIDCEDPDCRFACDDGCLVPTSLQIPSTENGSNVRHANTSDSSCQIASSFGGGGRDISFLVEATQDGSLRFTLNSNADLGIFAQTICGDETTEIGCKDDAFGLNATEILSVSVKQGDRFFVFVDGFQEPEAGEFALEVAQVATVCGNGMLEEGEQCEDGNQQSGDGCARNCRIEPVFESEPNDDGTTIVGNSIDASDLGDFSAKNANGPFTEDVIIQGSLEGAGDEDVFAVTNTTNKTVGVRAETFGSGGIGTCGINTVLVLRDEFGNDFLDNNDSLETCAALLNFNLGPEVTAFLHVSDFNDNTPIPFYYLVIDFLEN